MTVGVSGEPVSAQDLNNHFKSIKVDLKKAVELEKMHLSHFEVTMLVLLYIKYIIIDW